MTNIQLAPTGATLFHIAANAFGDATQWSRLALINGVRDPFLINPETLIVPLNAASRERNV